MIYLDHAATSWPKPPSVVRAMNRYLEEAGGNPGRSGHRLSVAAARSVYDAREAVAELLGAPDPLRVCFTLNVTYALNLALRGLLRPGDRVVTTSMEHNSVMRPLRDLERQDVQLTVAPCRPDGTLDMTSFRKAVTPGTRLVACTHASNVNGVILPVADMAAAAHDAGALILVDAAQTAGVLPLNVVDQEIDMLAFTGHKGLQGPPGTGGLILNTSVDPAAMDPLVRGGTGSRSEHEEQPHMLPDRYESGTCNGVGLAGLCAGVRWIQERGIEAIRAHELELATALGAGLREIPGITVYGPADPHLCTAVISCRVDGLRVSEVGLRLDDEYAVLSRVGLHCAPSAHRTLGTFPEGTIRLAPGVFTTRADIDHALLAFRRVAVS